MTCYVKYLVPYFIFNNVSKLIDVIKIFCQKIIAKFGFIYIANHMYINIFNSLRNMQWS